MNIKEFLSYAANITPSERQKKWFDREFYAFVHFSPNTCTGREWGLGNEDEAIFNPTDLDCDEWVSAIKSAGMKALILTAKHHDGFCLWQTETTMHSIKKSPYKNGRGDIVREAAEACRRGGIGFGVYLSPWDRNCPIYGTDGYNDFYRAQLTELLTNYGPLCEVWFDGACGEGPSGKKQVYDFESYISLIRKYQPEAVIFNDFGPDVRWCGNEAGRARHAEWAVVPGELVFRERGKPTGESVLEGSLEGIYNSDDNIGELSRILYSRGLVFAGAEVDMSIRPGWFYHENEEPHSLERLWKTYITSVGGNACFNLNIPPMPSGRFDKRDIARLAELGEKLKSEFSADVTELARVSMLRENASGTQCEYLFEFDEPVTLSYMVLCENIAVGQRISDFNVKIIGYNGNWANIYQGTCVGHKKICDLRSSHSPRKSFLLCINGARDKIELKSIRLYAEKKAEE